MPTASLCRQRENGDRGEGAANAGLLNTVIVTSRDVNSLKAGGANARARDERSGGFARRVGKSERDDDDEA